MTATKIIVYFVHFHAHKTDFMMKRQHFHTFFSKSLVTINRNAVQKESFFVWTYVQLLWPSLISSHERC